MRGAWADDRGDATKRPPEGVRPEEIVEQWLSIIKSPEPFLHSARIFPNLTLASTIHNNVEMSRNMIDSFLKFGGIPAEIVLVDDASAEPVKESNYASQVRILRNEKAIGFCRASDRVLREARTPFALLVDADVLFKEGDFGAAFEAFCASESAAWCVFAQVDNTGRPQSSFAKRLPPPWVFGLGNQMAGVWSKLFSPETEGQSPGAFVPVKAAHSSSTMVRMAAFRAIDGFDKWYWQCESDIDLSLRFLSAGYIVAVAPGYTVFHEGCGGKTGGHARVLDLYRARLHLYEKFYPSARVYLRLLLWCRHLLEVFAFYISERLLGRKSVGRLSLRMQMLRTVFSGYTERNQ